MMPIEELDLSVRTYSCLKVAKIDTVEQLKGLDDSYLMRIRNLSRRGFDEIKSKLSAIQEAGK